MNSSTLTTIHSCAFQPIKICGIWHIIADLHNTKIVTPKAGSNPKQFWVQPIPLLPIHLHGMETVPLNSVQINSLSDPKQNGFLPTRHKELSIADAKYLSGLINCFMTHLLKLAFSNSLPNWICSCKPKRWFPSIHSSSKEPNIYLIVHSYNPLLQTARSSNVAWIGNPAEFTQCIHLWSLTTVIPFHMAVVPFVKEHYNRDIFLDCQVLSLTFCRHCPFALQICFGSQIPKVSAYRSGFHCWFTKHPVRSCIPRLFFESKWA